MSGHCEKLFACVDVEGPLCVHEVDSESLKDIIFWFFTSAYVLISLRNVTLCGDILHPK